MKLPNCSLLFEYACKSFPDSGKLHYADNCADLFFSLALFVGCNPAHLKSSRVLPLISLGCGSCTSVFAPAKKKKKILKDA